MRARSADHVACSPAATVRSLVASPHARPQPPLHSRSAGHVACSPTATVRSLVAWPHARPPPPPHSLALLDPRVRSPSVAAVCARLWAATTTLTVGCRWPHARWPPRALARLAAHSAKPMLHVLAECSMCSASVWLGEKYVFCICVVR